jgi:hypothetical protein
MSTINELYWLAGLMEGDGSICLHRFKRPNGSWRIACDVLFINNDPNLINEVDRMARKYIGVTMYLQTRRVDDEKHATNYQLLCSSYTDCYKFLKAVVPYMRGEKRAVGNLMIRFLQSRGLPNKKAEEIRQPYTDIEHKIYEQTKNLTRRGVDKKLQGISETKRKTLITSDDIVRTSTRLEEASRNDLPLQNAE